MDLALEALKYNSDLEALYNLSKTSKYAREYFNSDLYFLSDLRRKYRLPQRSLRHVSPDNIDEIYRLYHRWYNTFEHRYPYVKHDELERAIDSNNLDEFIMLIGDLGELLSEEIIRKLEYAGELGRNNIIKYLISKDLGCRIFGDLPGDLESSIMRGGHRSTIERFIKGTTATNTHALAHMLETGDDFGYKYSLANAFDVKDRSIRYYRITKEAINEDIPAVVYWGATNYSNIMADPSEYFVYKTANFSKNDLSEMSYSIIRMFFNYIQKLESQHEYDIVDAINNALPESYHEPIRRKIAKWGSFW